MNKRKRQDDVNPLNPKTRFARDELSQVDVFHHQGDEPFCIYYAVQTFLLYSPFIRQNERLIVNVDDFKCEHDDGYCLTSAFDVLNQAIEVRGKIRRA